MVEPVIKIRAPRQDYTQQLIQAGSHPLLARLWAARGLSRPDTDKWSGLIAPKELSQIEHAAQVLSNAILSQKKLLIIADYDCDGATACAVAIRGLRSLGANVDFLVPNRFNMGYGLSPEIVELACQHHAGKPDILITVDNGIASVAGVAAAKRYGIETIITDHHLPGATTPDAIAIVNPNQAKCNFPSKNLAGVGVIFYVLLATRAQMRAQGLFQNRPEPRLNSLADLVALGTVADVVKLDANNRLLVKQGLKNIRHGKAHAGIKALFEVAGRDINNATANDLGFALGPRINAAGRMADMSLGINCLLEDDPIKAKELALELNQINLERRHKQATMSSEALDNINIDSKQASICLVKQDWHTGIIGLVASKVKETYWRPTIAFAPNEQGLLQGSGRSVPGVHIRDALDLVDKRLPNAIVKFGGHAMAAGLTLKLNAYEDFSVQLDQAIRTISGKDSFEPCLETDGPLETEYFNVATAELLSQQVWGAGFAEPLFQDEFKVIHQQLLKDAHLKLFLEKDGARFNAIWFNHNQYLPEQITAVYQLNKNVWQQTASLQLIIDYAA